MQVGGGKLVPEETSELSSEEGWCGLRAEQVEYLECLGLYHTYVPYLYIPRDFSRTKLDNYFHMS